MFHSWRGNDERRCVGCGRFRGTRGRMVEREKLLEYLLAVIRGQVGGRDVPGGGPRVPRYLDAIKLNRCESRMAARGAGLPGDRASANHRRLNVRVALSTCQARRKPVKQRETPGKAGTWSKTCNCRLDQSPRLSTA